MISLVDLWMVIGLFVLRIGVPAAIVVGLGYFLKRLDRRWEAEARAEQATAQGVQPGGQPAATPELPSPIPGRRPGLDVPGAQLPFDPDIYKGSEARGSKSEPREAQQP